VKIIVRIILVVIVLAILISLFYVDENWRGKRDWENCQREVQAEGDSLDWEDYIPPPVPDAQNFFKAQNMQKWFVRNLSDLTNEMVQRFKYSQTNSIIIAHLIVNPSASALVISENSDLVLRYNSFGNAIFLPSMTVETNTSSPNFIIPVIQFEDVPLTTAIENLARLAKIQYSLDPQIGYNQPDASGQIKPEPTLTLHWKDITAGDALLAILNHFDLQLIKNTKSQVALITIKNSATAQAYITDDAQEKIENLFSNALGTNLMGSQGVALFVKPIAEIKPLRMILESEKIPDESEMNALFTRFFQSATKISPEISVEKIRNNSFEISLCASTATNYLVWSDQFQSDFEQMREALKRPYARMDGDYRNIFSAPIPNFVFIRVVAQTFAQRAQCDFLLGKPENALRDLKLIEGLSRVLEEKPSGKPMLLVTAMTRVAVMGIYAETIKEGLELRVWQDTQLVELQNELKEIDLIPYVVDGLKTDPIIFCNFSESTWTNRFSASFKQVSSIQNPGPIPMPKGWVYENMVNVVRLSRMPLKGFDLTNSIISPHLLNDAANSIDTWADHKSLLKFYLIIPVTSFIRAEQTTVYNQTLINEAQIACALERYHLAHNEYPETLDALAPKFIQKIPRDIIGGQPLHYRRTNDGKFLLYSVGWNETDDGGLDLTSENGGFNSTNGDWVWKN
jgi:hypothetical protein